METTTTEPPAISLTEKYEFQKSLYQKKLEEIEQKLNEIVLKKEKFGIYDENEKNQTVKLFQLKAHYENQMKILVDNLFVKSTSLISDEIEQKKEKERENIEITEDSKLFDYVDQQQQEYEKLFQLKNYNERIVDKNIIQQIISDSSRASSICQNVMLNANYLAKMDENQKFIQSKLKKSFRFFKDSMNLFSTIVLDCSDITDWFLICSDPNDLVQQFHLLKQLK